MRKLIRISNPFIIAIYLLEYLLLDQYLDQEFLKMIKLFDYFYFYLLKYHFF